MVWQPEPVDWTWRETDSIVELRTACAALTVDRETFTVSYADAQGHVLLREDPARPRELEGYDAFVTDPDAPARVERVQTPDGEKSFVREGGRLFDRRLFRGRVHFLWQEGESLYGLGQHEEGLLDLRGHTVYLHQANLKIAVPVLVSSLGYGILLDTYGPAVFRDRRVLPQPVSGGRRGVGPVLPPGRRHGRRGARHAHAHGPGGSAAEVGVSAISSRRSAMNRRRSSWTRPARSAAWGSASTASVLDWNSWEDGYWGQKRSTPPASRIPAP